MKIFHFVCMLSFFWIYPGDGFAGSARSIIDITGREVQIHQSVNHVICSGPGCLRMLTYLQAEDMAVAVDDIEIRREKFNARPYALANPQLKERPVFGAFRGRDNPERILTLHPQPEIIFKTYPKMGHDGVELQKKTGIPVILLNDGSLGQYRKELYQSLRIMGEVIGKQSRAEEIISFFESHIAELEQMTGAIAWVDRPRVFVGGVAFKGSHGYQSTEPAYPPFVFVKADNVASEKIMTGKQISHSEVAKESIILWDPDFLFVDLSTLQLGENAGGVHELCTDPVYRSLGAVKKGKIYGLLPYNRYSKNYGSILANTYFIGKVLYPSHFQNVDPVKKADEIYEFLVGAPVFANMKKSFNDMAFVRIPME